MKTRTFAAVLTIVFSLFATQSTAQQAGWVELFNGEDMEGWIQRGGKANYTAKDGMIEGSTVPNTPNSFLCTEKNYGDFELQLEFKVDPQLNSGIQIRSISDPEIKNGRVHGYQVEIDPSERAWSCGIYDEGRRGWLFDLKDNPEARYAFKQNEWNHYRIVAVGDSIKTWINGVAAADLTDDMTSEGFIALQVHGVGGRKDPIKVTWRNIRLREIAADEKPKATSDKSLSQVKPIGDAVVRQLADGFAFVEGPAMGPDGRIYFSDIPNEKIHVLDPETGNIQVFREESGKSNGLVWTPNDALIACEGGARRVSIRRQDGSIKTIVDKFEDMKLNSPNDITLDGVGGFYFTDPRYGNRDNMEVEIEGVYYVNRGRKISRIIDDLRRPNGIELSNDGKTLYVADTTSGVFAFDVDGPGKVSNKRMFADVRCDGMAIDQNGSLYLTSGKFVHVYGHDGDLSSKLEFPENPANVTFGGPQRSVLFVTARTGLYSVPSVNSGSRVYANPQNDND